MLAAAAQQQREETRKQSAQCSQTPWLEVWARVAKRKQEGRAECSPVRVHGGVVCLAVLLPVLLSGLLCLCQCPREAAAV
jgi:hypothetical protein